MKRLLTKIYLKFFIPSGFPYAAYLKSKQFLQSQGDNCYIAKSANLPDPYLTRIGSNVWITAGCQLLCHDASVIMINRMRGGHLDRVGPITIGDNVFLGNGVIVLPDIAIGSGVIVGAGSVVTKHVPDNAVVAGNPARHICSLDEYTERIEAATETYPWRDLLKTHSTHVYDPELEEKLRTERIRHFFTS